MSVHLQPMSELSQRATRALIQDLGVVDTLRFLNQFRVGQGDYTAERKQIFAGETVKDIVVAIKVRRSL